jgi:hypothetical protein
MNYAWDKPCLRSSGNIESGYQKFTRTRGFSACKSMLEALIQMLKIHAAAWEFGYEINKFRPVAAGDHC